MKIISFFIATAGFIATLYYADSNMGNDVGKAIIFQTLSIMYWIIAREKENKN